MAPLKPHISISVEATDVNTHRYMKEWRKWITTPFPQKTGHHKYQTNPKYWDRQACANNVDVDQDLQYNLNGLNPDGLFTVDDSNSFFSPYKILPIAQENKYIGILFSYFIMELYVVCTHKNCLIEAILMSTLNIQLLCRKSRKNSLNHRYLLPDLAPWLTLSGLNYPCLEQFLWSQRCSSHWSLTVHCSPLIQNILDISTGKRMNSFKF